MTAVAAWRSISLEPANQVFSLEEMQAAELLELRPYTFVGKPTQLGRRERQIGRHLVFSHPGGKTIQVGGPGNRTRRDLATLRREIEVRIEGSIMNGRYSPVYSTSWNAISKRAACLPPCKVRKARGMFGMGAATGQPHQTLEMTLSSEEGPGSGPQQDATKLDTIQRLPPEHVQFSTDFQE